MVLPGDLMPRALLVEYLPVEFTEAGEDGWVFAKSLTQFYFRCALQVCWGRVSAPNMYCDVL
jgi:hypothetical protein